MGAITPFQGRLLLACPAQEGDRGSGLQVAHGPFEGVKLCVPGALDRERPKDELREPHSQVGLEEVAKWASYHHERIDETGYPFRLRGDQLPLLSKAMCVADVFQALNQDRPYRGALASRDVIRFMREMVRDHALDAGIAELVIDDYDTFHQLAARSSASNAAFATPL